MNLWKVAGVPHNGWTCIGMCDLGADGLGMEPSEYATCEMCGKEKIRYVHTMSHPDYKNLDVGCICAGNMEEDRAAARERERPLRNRTSRQAGWLRRKWKTSAKGYQYLKTKGYNIGVMPSRSKAGHWIYWMGYETLEPKFSKQSYLSEKQAKLELLEAFEAHLEDQKKFWGSMDVE